MVKKKGELVDSLCREITLQKAYLNDEVVETIYFGGGTPSLLAAAELEKILLTLAKTFDCTSVAEITLEANPEDLNAASLEHLVRLGVNRLSIGIQSFHDEHLKFMNRSHTSAQASKSVKLAQQAGIENISIDLIYGIPSDSHFVWQSDLEKAIALGVPHISAYCLTIEEKTVFGKWQKTGKIAPIDDEFAAEQFEILNDHLEKAAYEAYEISNFALPGRYSKHNTAYWQQKKYLGIGPSAHSFNLKSRQFNVANNALYIRALNEDKIPSTLEELTQAEAFNEYLLTTLRTKWGTSLNACRQLFGVDMLQLKEGELAILQTEELLFTMDSTLYLTKKGKLLADEITSRLML